MPRLRTFPGRARGIQVRMPAVPAVPAAPAVDVQLIGSTSGSSASGTSATITLPPREAGDYLTLLVSSNQAPTLGFSAGVSSSAVLASAASRLQAIRITPAAGATSVTLTSSVSAVLTWWCASWRNVDPAATVRAAADNVGSNTSAAIAAPAVDLGWIATGHEVYVRAAGVNGAATWGASPSAVFSTVAGNGALSVRSGLIPAGALATAGSTPFDRGAEGTTRNESALAFVLAPVQTPQVNLLTNGSFEAGGAPLATGWETEATAPRLPTMSRSAVGVVDGAVAQRLQFTGQAGDAGNVAIYQAPIPAVAGQVMRATIYLSGTLTGAYAIFGIEGFVSAGGAYISEHDTVIDAGTLTATPVQFTVEYTCPPSCTALAVYVQVPTVAPTSVVDLLLDRAILQRIA